MSSSNFVLAKFLCSDFIIKERNVKLLRMIKQPYGAFRQNQLENWKENSKVSEKFEFVTELRRFSDKVLWNYCWENEIIYNLVDLRQGLLHWNNVFDLDEVWMWAVKVNEKVMLYRTPHILSFLSNTPTRLPVFLGPQGQYLRSCCVFFSLVMHLNLH